MSRTLIATMIVGVMLLAGCDYDTYNETVEYAAICIDGVEYWEGGAGYTYIIAPRVDPKTLTFVRCTSPEAVTN